MNPLTLEEVVLRIAEVYYDLRQFAFAYIGSDLRLIRYSEPFLYFIDNDSGTIEGQRIDHLFLPLVGAEHELQNILVGRQREYALQRISTQRRDNALLYFNFRVVSASEAEPDKGLILMVENITERSILEQKIVQQRNELELLSEQLVRVNTLLDMQARTDALTGLSNRRHFNEQLLQTLEVAVKHNTDTGLILMDVDGFKQINDMYGHLAGDELLEVLGMVLQRNLRDKDTAARFGGDELAVILPKTDLHGALVVASRLQKAVIESPEVQPYLKPEMGVGMSFGVAVAPLHGETPAALVHAADMALYVAKRNGKNQVRIYMPSLPTK
jgi:diguanylate cyclase (GGDEF)-like protein